MVSTSIPVPKYNCINTRVVIFYKKNKQKTKVSTTTMVSSIKRVLCPFYLSTSTTNHSINKSRLYMHCQSYKKYEHVSTIYLHVSTTPNVNYSVNNNIQQQSKLKEKYKEKQFKDIHVLSTPVVYRCSNKTIGHLSY